MLAKHPMCGRILGPHLLKPRLLRARTSLSPASNRASASRSGYPYSGHPCPTGYPCSGHPLEKKTALPIEHDIEHSIEFSNCTSSGRQPSLTRDMPPSKSTSSMQPSREGRGDAAMVVNSFEGRCDMVQPLQCCCGDYGSMALGLGRQSASGSHTNS